MHDLKKLKRMLKGIQGRPFVGTVFRCIDLIYIASPMSAIGGQRAGGRFTPKGGTFEALYASLEPDTAKREMNGVPAGSPFLEHPPSLDISIKVALKNVIDLNEHLEAFGSNPQEFFGPWQPMTGNGQLAPTQILGMAIHANPLIEGYLFDSSKVPGSRNLGIQIQHLQPGSSVEVFDPRGTFDRISIRKA